MRLSGHFLVLFGSAALIGLISACGGGEETATATQVPAATATRTASAGTTIPVATATSAPAASIKPTAGLSQALDPFPYEVDNVKYGGAFRYPWARSYGYLDFKFVAQIWDVYPAVEKPVEWVANAKDSLSHLEPMLAEKWQTSTDFKTYTLTLKKGINWHNIAPVNGREFVADDVVFNVKRYAEKDSVRLAFYSQVATVEATDKYTVKITLNEPNAWLMNDLWGGLDWLLPSELVREMGGTIGTKLIGTGPYMLKEYSPNRQAVYTRNPGYWGKDSKGNQLPYTDTFEFVFVADSATTTAAFRTGQLDLGPSLSTMGTSSALEGMTRSMPGTRIVNLGAAQPRHLSFNTKKAPWNDVRVRRAFNMYIDKEKFAEAIFEPGTWVYSTPLSWTDVTDKPFTLDDLGSYAKYNPSEAKKLMIEAGFADGRMKVPSPVEYAIGTGSSSHVVFGQNLQQLLKQHGVEIELQGLAPAAYYAKWYLHNYDDLSLGFVNTGDYSLIWYAQNKFLDNALQNTSQINDPEVQKVIKQIKVESDPAKLRQHAKFLWDYDINGSWNVWTPTQAQYDIVSARLRNYTIRRGSVYTGLRTFPWLADAPRTSP